MTSYTLNSRVKMQTQTATQNISEGLQKDGLTDAYDHKAMGSSGDATAKKYGFTREAQDEYAIRSYKRAKEATESGRFSAEITAVEIPQRKGDPIAMDEDEEPKNVRFDKNILILLHRESTKLAALRVQICQLEQKIPFFWRTERVEGVIKTC